jgi:hypothetical protein
MESFFIIKRPVEQDPLYFSEKFNRWHAWIDLVGMARFESGTIYLNKIPVKLQRGDVARAIETLADRWRWNPRTVKKFLKELREDGRIIFHSSPRTGTVIHIVDYDSNQRTGKPEKCRTENRSLATGNIDECETGEEKVQNQMQNQVQKNNNDKQKKAGAIGNSIKNPIEAKGLHLLYCLRFEEMTGIKYHVGSIARELKDLNDLLTTYSYEQIQGIIDTFFDTTDQWIIDNGYPWRSLIKRASALAVKCAKKNGVTNDIDDAEAMEQFFNNRRKVA